MGTHTKATIRYTPLKKKNKNKKLSIIPELLLAQVSARVVRAFRWVPEGIQAGDCSLFYDAHM